MTGSLTDSMIAGYLLPAEASHFVMVFTCQRLASLCTRVHFHECASKQEVALFATDGGLFTKESIGGVNDQSLPPHSDYAECQTGACLVVVRANDSSST
jgi:hypothetical protein